MATISFKTFPYGDGSYDVYAFNNKHEHTLIKDSFDYADAVALEREREKDKKQNREHKTLAVFRIGYCKEDFRSLFNLLDMALDIKHNDPEREPKLRLLLPFADKWDVSGVDFTEELWEESEFLHKLLKDRHDDLTYATETESGHYNGKRESQYNFNED